MEQLEPLQNQARTIASAIYNHPLKDGSFQTVFAWGRLKETSPIAVETDTSDAYLIESALTLGPNTVFGRGERVGKDELFPIGSPQDGEVFTVTKVSLGYQRTFDLPRHLATDVGGLFSKYIVPQALDATYGSDPGSFMLFTRLHLRS